MQCEMCGSKEAAYETSVEGAVLNLCENCSKYGKVVNRIAMQPVHSKKTKLKPKQPTATSYSVPTQDEVVFVITPGYARMIKKKRESLGLKQSEMAKRLNERESLLSKIESSAMEPSIKLARKLENFLKIKLIEEHKEEKRAFDKVKSGITTIGDMIKIRKK
ncbi:multiprotein bridging factor aMBF1 [Candidatus Woesearchaeota archaeon]|nr:multiprotein bridging factor aMBF1 [Candidatus Woesearchaeota archaeon]